LKLVLGKIIQTRTTITKIEFLFIMHNIKLIIIYVECECTDWVQMI